jgi:hypothetical protein
MRAVAPSLLLACLLPLAPATDGAAEEPRPASPPQESEAASTARTREQASRGAAPGNEEGPGGFVPRKEKRTFYAASGGQLWYYLNLYYWAPKGCDTTDLWIKAEVVEVFKDLRRWPDASPVAPPPAKVTVEYWEVGPTGRTFRIDNHKDFWFEAENYCAGAVDVTMTVELGRVTVRDALGGWKRPDTHYVLDRRSYEPGAGIGAANIRFDPLARTPVNVWGYAIPWSKCPGRFLRSDWAETRVPRIELRGSRPRASDESPVTTEPR